MKDYRGHIGNFQFIARLGFDKENFGIGLTATYLDGFQVADMKIFGFWNIEFEFLVIVLTMNVTDKKFRTRKNFLKPKEDI